MAGEMETGMVPNGRTGRKWSSACLSGHLPGLFGTLPGGNHRPFCQPFFDHFQFGRELGEEDATKQKSARRRSFSLNEDKHSANDGTIQEMSFTEEV